MMFVPSDHTHASTTFFSIRHSEVPKLREIYGDNKFDIPVPPYMQLLKEQLMSPLAMFQLFCSFLFCLDAYWKYTLMQLSTIIGFDAMTASACQRSHCMLCAKVAIHWFDS